MKMAFFSGDREEARRDVYAEHPQELSDKLQITREQVLKWENCCIRSSKRVERMVETSGSCLDSNFMFMSGTELVGLIGVHVGDFLVAGRDDDPIFSAVLSKPKGTCQ